MGSSFVDYSTANFIIRLCLRSVKPKANEIPFSFNKMRKALDLLVQIVLFPLPRIHSETVRRCSRHLPELTDFQENGTPPRGREKRIELRSADPDLRGEHFEESREKRIEHTYPIAARRIKFSDHDAEER